jgi:hypothetical protein
VIYGHQVFYELCMLVHAFRKHDAQQSVMVKQMHLDSSMVYLHPSHSLHSKRRLYSCDS